MRPLIALSLLLMAGVPPPAQAAIEKNAKTAKPADGIAVPKQSGPQLLECWIDGERLLVQTEPGRPLPLVPRDRTLVIRHPDGRFATVTVTESSGCYLHSTPAPAKKKR